MELRTFIMSFHVYALGKFGVVYKALYTSKENTITEVAVKTVKCINA